MSLCATIWAWKQTSLTPSQKLILLSLADRANEEHKAHPSIKRLEVDTGLNRKTIQKSISEMIDAGLLVDTGERKGATQRVRVLQLVGVKGREDGKANDPKNGTISNSNDPNISTNDPKNGMIKRSQNRDLESLITEPTIESDYNNRDLDIEKRFKITANWKPSSQIEGLSRLVFANYKKYHTQENLNRFLAYWIGQPKEFNDHQWHLKYLEHLRHLQVNGIEPEETKEETEFERMVRTAKDKGLEPYKGYPHENPKQFIARVKESA